MPENDESIGAENDRRRRIRASLVRGVGFDGAANAADKTQLTVNRVHDARR
jgi:hypothetical protein